MTHVGREQEVPALTPPPARTPAAALAVRAGLAALVAAALFFCYWRQSQAVPLSSDGSSNVLQAWAMLRSCHMYRMRRLATTASAGSTHAAIVTR